MADNESSKERGAPRRRRPAATIDLPASEISPPHTPESATIAAADAGVDRQASGPDDTADTPEAAASPPPPHRQDESAATSAAEPPRTPRNPPWPKIAAAAVAANVILMAVVAWLLFDFMRNRDVDTSDVAERVGKVEAAMSAQKPATADPALVARIGTLETTIRTMSEAVAGFNGRADDSAAALRDARTHIDAAEQANASLRLTLERQREAAPDKSDLEQLSGRITALESATRTVQKEIDPKGGVTADRAVRRALLASALRDNVLRGAPFAAELAALKSLGDDASLAALEPFAANGLPSAEALSGELTALLPKLGPTPATVAHTGSLMERLQVNASQLVRIRPLNEAAGDDTGAILGRVETKTARNDIDGALADLLRLPAATREPAAAWIAKAQARQAAVAAAQAVAKDALGALSQTVQRP